ncbi:small RNA 2'-O-methyltransferase [Takifugu rubripes]|uniref:small RNA 2'-O-methyltransferase n=1 Tax=Takifugu rubripes TaxID=31033 RepID=UPI0011451F43|nr:small RNA 2'-O-methyltransferase [Takifugu rubripes]
MFSPSLHTQRHQFVIDFVVNNKPQKVVDLGCCECKLLKKLKFHRQMKLLVGVDINGATVKKHMYGLAPLSTDYLQPSEDELRIELYQGSVTEKDARLRGFDLVTSIELIEHLSLASLSRFSEVVFGYMTPLAVIISTPNSEFNPLLPGLKGFRHSDHKFEWTRAEFKSWALKVCKDYGYTVEFTGVGPAPPGQQESVGFCSQIGVFRCLGGRDACGPLLDDEDDVCSYTLLYSVNYPSLRDNNTLRRVLVNEVMFWAENLKKRFVEKMAEKDDAEHSAAVGAEMEDESAGECGAEMGDFLERCRGMPEDQVFWADNSGQQESPNQIRSVSIPLAVLWVCSPKISTLSGCLNNLRHFLMEEPKVTLNQDGSAVLLLEKDTEEDAVDLEDSGFAEVSRTPNRAEPDQKEEWEANI